MPGSMFGEADYCGHLLCSIYTRPAHIAHSGQYEQSTRIGALISRGLFGDQEQGADHHYGQSIPKWFAVNPRQWSSPDHARLSTDHLAAR
jgi:hypothetical protein